MNHLTLTQLLARLKALEQCPDCGLLPVPPMVTPRALADLRRHAEMGRLLEEGLSLWLEVAIDVVGPHGCKLYLGGDIEDTFAATPLDALRAALGEKA